jgi:hypothetical protein
VLFARQSLLSVSASRIAARVTPNCRANIDGLTPALNPARIALILVLVILGLSTAFSTLGSAAFGLRAEFGSPDSSATVAAPASVRMRRRLSSPTAIPSASSSAFESHESALGRSTGRRYGSVADDFSPGASLFDCVSASEPDAKKSGVAWSRLAMAQYCAGIADWKDHFLAAKHGTSAVGGGSRSLA